MKCLHSSRPCRWVHVQLRGGRCTPARHDMAVSGGTSTAQDGSSTPGAGFDRWVSPGRGARGFVIVEELRAAACSAELRRRITSILCEVGRLRAYALVGRCAGEVLV